MTEATKISLLEGRETVKFPDSYRKRISPNRNKWNKFCKMNSVSID